MAEGDDAIRTVKAQEPEEDLRVRARIPPEWEYSPRRAGPAAGILTPGSNSTNGAFCVTRREAWATGFDRGAGLVLYGRYPPARWPRPNPVKRAGGYSPLPCARPHQRDGKA